MASWRRAVFLAITGSASIAALAQPADPAIDQISDVPASAEMPLNPAEPGLSVAPPVQLASDAESSPATPQVTVEARAAPSAEQLSKVGRTAQPPQALSRRSEGRPSGVERLAGADRCDPAQPHLSRTTCARVIENRSAEFARPDPATLSPEQRLLLEQEVREGALDPVTGARKLARTGQAEESLAAMGVASTIMQPQADTPEQRKPDEDVSKAVEIIGAIINQPLAPPPQ